MNQTFVNTPLGHSPRNTRFATRWFGVVTLLCLVAVTLPLTGCGEKKTVEPIAFEPEKTPEELAKEREEIRRKQVQERFQRAMSLARKDPSRWSDHIQNFENSLFEAQGIKFLEEDIKKALKAQVDAREKFASDRLKTLAEQARKLVKEQDYLTAHEVLESFDEEGVLGETKAMKEQAIHLEFVRRAEDAEVEGKRIMRRAQSLYATGVLEEIARAIGVLVSYPDAYADTVWYKEIQELIEEYLPEYERLTAEEKEVMDVPEIVLEIDEYLGNFRTYGDSVWTASDGVATGNNETDQPALVQIGEDNWTSYQMRLFIKVPGDLARLAVTSRPGRGSIRNYGFYKVDIEESDWFEVMITFRNGTVTVQNLNTREEMMDSFNPRSDQGAVAFRIDPGESIEFKDVRVQVFSKFEPEEENGE